jgi:WXG100 family type VII secretion target
MIYTVDFARAEAVLSQLDSIDRQIRTMLTTLEEDSQRNLAEWVGEARAAYAECKARWDASAARMPQLLGQAQIALREIMTGYRSAERSNSGTLSGAGR